MPDNDYVTGMQAEHYAEQEVKAYMDSVQRETFALRVLLAEVEQLRVQLAGCLVAAEGWADKGEAVKQGDYGWSLAFEKTRTLRKERDALLAVTRQLVVAWRYL